MMSTLSTINSYFKNILNRAPIGNEADGWVNLVDLGIQTLDQVRTAFVTSPEVQARVSPIVQMYSTELGRTPDQPGLAFWVGEEDSGALTLAQIGAAIADSAESKATYGTTVDEAFLIKLYQNALNRAPEDGVVASWIASGLTTTQIVAFFAISPEASARDFLAVNNYLKQADDQGNSTLIPGGPLEPVVPPVINNTPTPPPTFTLSAPVSVDDGSKILVTLDTTNVVAGANYQYKITGIPAADLVSGVLTGSFTVDSAGKAAVELTLSPNTPPETLTLTLLNGKASTHVAVTGNQTFTLTTGLDNGAAFTGGSGNDTFQAGEVVSSGPLPTWTSGDAIDGGGGSNTFNVTQTAAVSPVGTTVKNIQAANITGGAGVTVDTTDWTGLTKLNVTDVGATILTSAGATAVNVNDTAGNVTITGGSTQAVSTSSGVIDLSGATGAVTLTDTAAGNRTVTVNGGTTVAATISGRTAGGTINIGTTTAPTGPVTVIATELPTETGSHTAGTINVAGGTLVHITANLAGAPGNFNTITAGTVNVVGTADTTSVTIDQTPKATAGVGVPGVVNNTVNISDVNQGSTDAGTITSITAHNFTTLGIGDNALTELDISGGSGNIIIDNSGLTTATNKTLAATVDGQTGGTLDDADIYTKLNITTANNNSTLANLTFGGLTALTVAGTKRLTLTSTAGLSALHTVTVSGQAGVTGDFSAATVTGVDTSATTGASRVTVDASKATFTGGAGSDSVTTTASTVSHAISLGGGDDSLILGNGSTPTAAVSGGAGTDTLTMSSALAATASGSPTFAGIVTGFERLILTGATNQTIDLDVLGFGTNSDVTTSGGNGFTLTNMSTGGSLTLSGAGTAYTIGNSAFSSGSNDTINLHLTDGSGAGVSFAATGITASGVEHFAISTIDTQLTPTGTFNDTVTLLGNSSKTITVAGNAGLTLTATSTALTSVDASEITLGGFTWTSGALAAAAAVTGSATGTNTVNFAAATGGAVTYTGGSGDDAVTATNGKANVFHLGEGTNTLTASGGSQTVTGGSGSDSVTLGSGNNTVDLGNGTNSFTATTGNNTYTGGSGANTLTLGGGANTVTLGAHSDTTSDAITVGANGVGSHVPTAVITGLNSAGLDTITFAGDSSANSFTAFTGVQLNTFAAATGTTNPPDTIAAAINDVLAAVGGNLANHGIGAFQFGGNTYLVEQANGQGTAFTTGDTLVELNGTVTFNSPTVTTGVLHLT